MMIAVLKPHFGKLFVLIVSLSAVSGCSHLNNQYSGKNILIMVSEGYGVNLYLNQDSFDQYGWNVTYASLQDTIHPCNAFASPKGAQPIVADIKIEDIIGIDNYDALVIVPSTQYDPAIETMKKFLDSEKVIALLKEAGRKNIPIFSLCAGGRLLAAADLIKGKKVVGSPKFKDEYLSAGATFLGNDHAPVIDGNIVTAVRDLYYNQANMMALQRLWSKAIIEEIMILMRC